MGNRFIDSSERAQPHEELDLKVQADILLNTFGDLGHLSIIELTGIDERKVGAAHFQGSPVCIDTTWFTGNTLYLACAGKPGTWARPEFRYVLFTAENGMLNKIACESEFIGPGMKFNAQWHLAIAAAASEFLDREG